MKKKTNVTRERRKIIMTENNYSIFDDVTMPEYLKDKNLPEHYYYLLKYVGKTGQTLELIEEAINAEEEGKRPILKVASKKLLTAELCLVAVQKIVETWNLFHKNFETAKCMMLQFKRMEI